MPLAPQMTHCSFAQRSLSRRAASLLLVSTLGGVLALGACRRGLAPEGGRERQGAATATPMVPASVTVAPSAMTVARATAVPVATATPAGLLPDAAGYFVSPRHRLRYYSEYIRLDDGPAGSFLQELQERLSTHDTAWLEDLVDSGPQGGLGYRELSEDGPREPGALIDTNAVIDRLAKTAGLPVIQGYYLSRGDAPLSILWSDDVEAVDRLAIVITGWGSPSSSPTHAEPTSEGPASGAAVWRFEKVGASWRWRAWEWVAGGDYTRTVVALERSFGEIPSGQMSAFYHSVRTADRWPKPKPTVVAESPSPDGAWLARVVSTDGELIDPRDPNSWRTYSAVEVLDAAGRVVDSPLAFWQGDGFGGHVPGILQWRPDRGDVILADWGSGDGCVLHSGGALYRYDPISRTRTSLPAGAGSVMDPTARWLAAVGPGGVAIYDIDASTVVSATFPLQAQEYFEATWAPDSSAVAFTLVDEYRVCAHYLSSHVLRFDRVSGQLRDLTQPAPGGWRVQRWHENGRLEVQVEGPRDEEGIEQERTVWLDAATGAELRP